MHLKKAETKNRLNPGKCHYGYAQVDSSCAINEGLASFLSAAIIDNELTDAGHVFYNNNANVFQDATGEVDLLQFNHMVGAPILAAKSPPFFTYNPLTSGPDEEFSVASLLWHLYKIDDNKISDMVNIALSPSIVTTVDLYKVLSNSKLSGIGDINTIFADFGICVDSNNDGKCTPGEVKQGLTDWQSSI